MNALTQPLFHRVEKIQIAKIKGITIVALGRHGVVLRLGSILTFVALQNGHVVNRNITHIAAASYAFDYNLKQISR